MRKKIKSRVQENKPRRILVIRTDRIGDVILTLPLADALKKHFPGADIDFLVNARTRDLLIEYPNINKVHTIEKVTVNGIKQVCKESAYDLAIIVYPRLQVAMGVYNAGVKLRLGTAYRWYSFLFNLKHYEHRKDSVKHELEYNLNLLEELGVEGYKPAAPVLPVSETDLKAAERKLVQSGVEPEKGFIVIHIPTLGSAKVWSDRNFVSLIDLLLGDANFTHTIILTGTAGDEVRLNRFVKSVKETSRVITVLNLDLRELKAAIKLSDIFIGNSTGPIHIAAAVGTFVIGFYSPVKAESSVRWGPFTEKKKIFSPGSDSNDRDVMDDIKPGEVYKFIMHYLSTKKQ